jgi:signal peptidase I
MTVLGWCRRLASWLVAGTCLAALVVGLLVPRLFGATPYTVLTGSMTPHLPPGTLVVVRTVDPGEIGTDSVITYQLESGRPEVVTHRVVEVRTSLTGEVEWRTKGDANDAADPEWVREEQVRGQLWYAVPHLGRVGTWLSPTHREQLVQGIAGLLLLYAAVMLARGLSGRRQDQARPAEPQRVPEEVSA